MLRGHDAKMTNSHPWRYNFSCRADGTAVVHIGVFGKRWPLGEFLIWGASGKRALARRGRYVKRWCGAR